MVLSLISLLILLCHILPILRFLYSIFIHFTIFGPWLLLFSVWKFSVVLLLNELNIVTFWSAFNCTFEEAEAKTSRTHYLGLILNKYGEKINFIQNNCLRFYEQKITKKKKKIGKMVWKKLKVCSKSYCRLCFLGLLLNSKNIWKEPIIGKFKWSVTK